MGRIIIWFSVAVLLANCGVESVVAGRNPVVPEELRKFPERSWRLTNVRLFLWRDDMTSEDVSETREIGDRLDELDLAAIPLNSEQLALNNQLIPVKDSYYLINKQLRSLKKAVKNIGKSKKAAETDQETAKTELDKLLAGPDPDPVKVRALEDKITELSGTIQAQAQALLEIAPTQTQVQADLDAKRTERKRLEALMSALGAKQAKIFMEGKERVDRLMEIVDYYKEQPSAVALILEDDGTTRVNISSWNLGDGNGAQNFSSVPPLGGGDPAIYNVSYEPVGGVYEFDLDVFEDLERTEIRDTFHFKFSRTNYDATDGRTFFGGEIEKYNYDEDESRYGIAKLADRNN